MNEIDEKIQSYLVRARQICGFDFDDINKDTFNTCVEIAKLIQREEHYAKKEEMQNL